MEFILVSFKNFKYAKTRLRNDLSDSLTEEIATKMLENVLTEVSKSMEADKKFLLTNDEKAIQMGISKNLEIMRETKQINESSSIDKACKILISKGAKGVLRIPADLPLIESKDIDRLILMGKSDKKSILVPSESQTGTNAFYRTPPDVVDSCFGENSLKKHINLLDKKKAKYEVIKMKSFETDIDCIEDLIRIRSSNKKTRIIQYLKNINL